MEVADLVNQLGGNGCQPQQVTVSSHDPYEVIFHGFSVSEKGTRGKGINDYDKLHLTGNFNHDTACLGFDLFFHKTSLSQETFQAKSLKSPSAQGLKHIARW